MKTVRYDEPRYVGDAVNVINLFNRFEVDEIVLLDIRATVEGRPPDVDLVERLAGECWVPLSYGGGIRSVEQVAQVLRVGVEKVILGTVVHDDPSVVTAAAERFGRQAVVVSVDARQRSPHHYGAFVASGRRPTGVDAVQYAQQAARLGAGEILLNAVDRDGTMSGFDLELIGTVAGSVDVPVIACGGAGKRTDLLGPLEMGAAAVAAGSLFVYRGPERGVLVNFPERDSLERLLEPVVAARSGSGYP